ncbi:MAG: hypothetical protein ACFFB2_09385 [Promethearchaeota archaeon]
MTEITSRDEFKVKVCILSHPEELVSHFIQKLLQKHKERALNRNFAALGLSISTISLFADDKPVKLILIQTSGQKFMEKLRVYYQGASGAIILFERNNSDSFESAKRHFHYFQNIILNPRAPIIFIDVLEINPLIDDPERLTGSPNVLYYEINENNFQAFNDIIESIIYTYISTRVTS